MRKGKIAAGVDAPDGLRVEAHDRSGPPLRGLRVAAVLRRPATEDGLRSVSFGEMAPGLILPRHQ